MIHPLFIRVPDGNTSAFKRFSYPIFTLEYPSYLYTTQDDFEFISAIFS